LVGSTVSTGSDDGGTFFVAGSPCLLCAIIASSFQEVIGQVHTGHPFGASSCGIFQEGSCLCLAGVAGFGSHDTVGVVQGSLYPKCSGVCMFWTGALFRSHMVSISVGGLCPAFHPISPSFVAFIHFSPAMIG